MKDQFVIAHLTDLEHTDIVVSHALRIAGFLQKCIILLYVEDEKYNGLTADEATPKLKALSETLPDASYCALKGKTKEIISSLPTMLNGVVVVAQVNRNAPKRTAMHYKEVLRNYEESKIAFLTVQEKASHSDSWGKVAMTVDYRKESKEKLIWTSYFARFNHSQINILSQHYKDEGLRDLWRNNMLYLRKFFEKLSLTYLQDELLSNSSYPDIDALLYCQQHEIGILIATTTPTREVDFWEWITGTQECKTIINEQHIPILFINPREDLYVLCD